MRSDLIRQEVGATGADPVTFEVHSRGAIELASGHFLFGLLAAYIQLGEGDLDVVLGPAPLVLDDLLLSGLLHERPLDGEPARLPLALHLNRAACAPRVTSPWRTSSNSL
ncbi:hypothetical protein ACLQ97_17415, partial [Bordetella avium]